MPGDPEHALCLAAELPDPGARGFAVGEGDWPLRVVVVHRGGNFYAYANVCPHQRHPLDLPRDRFLTPDGSLLRCASHGAMFVPETGECIAGPCAGQALSPLPCRVVNGKIRVTAPAAMPRDGI